MLFPEHRCPTDAVDDSGTAANFPQKRGSARLSVRFRAAQRGSGSARPSAAQRGSGFRAAQRGAARFRFRAAQRGAARFRFRAT